MFFRRFLIAFFAITFSFSLINPLYHPRPALAQEVTPETITLYDSDNNVIPSYNEWMRDTLEAAEPPFFSRTDVGVWFATWKFLSKGDTTYMSVGVDRPMQTAGALFVKALVQDDDRTKLKLEVATVTNRLNDDDEPVQFLDEDGLEAMAWVDEDEILITGTDPSYQDNSDPAGGNMYRYNATTDTLTKIRCFSGNQTGSCGGDENNIIFPDVVHFLGISVLGDSVYVSGSVPDDINSDPVVYKSINKGTTWSRTAVIDDQWYRGTDLIAFTDQHGGITRENVVMSTANKYGIWASNAILYSNDQGAEQAGVDWTQITENVFQFDNDSVHTHVKGTLFQGTPIYVEGYYNYNSLFQLQKNGSGVYEPTEISLGDLKLGDLNDSSLDFYKKNAMIASEDWVYIIADDDAIYRSDLSEPVSWTKVAQFDEHIVTIHYWPEQQAIIASSRGLDAKLYIVDLPWEPESSEITPTPTASTGQNNSQSSQDSTQNKPKECTNQPPSYAPDLFQIDSTDTSATLYYAPAGDPYTNYHITYGLADQVDRYGAEIELKDREGVLKYTINALAPSTEYFFKVRANNGCKTGSWSKSMSVKTAAPNSFMGYIFYAYYSTVGRLFYR